MDKLLYAFFFFFIMLTGFLIQSEVAGLDVSNWNFTGSEWAKAIVPYLGLLYMAICIAGIVLAIRWKK